MSIHMETLNGETINWSLEIGRCSKYLQKKINEKIQADGEQQTYGVFRIPVAKSILTIIKCWAEHYKNAPSYEEVYNRGHDDEPWDNQFFGELDTGWYSCPIC